MKPSTRPPAGLVQCPLAQLLEHDVLLLSGTAERDTKYEGITHVHVKGVETKHATAKLSLRYLDPLAG